MPLIINKKTTKNVSIIHELNRNKNSKRTKNSKHKKEKRNDGQLSKLVAMMYTLPKKKQSMVYLFEQ